MASFQECLKNSKINASYIKRNSLVMELNSAVSNVKLLSKETPKVRQFLALEKEVDGLMSRLKTENALFTQLLMSQNPDISTEGQFTSDQTSIRSHCFTSLQVVDDYRGLLEDKKLVKSAIEEQDATIHQQGVTDLLAKLSENLKTLTDIGKNQ